MSINSFGLKNVMCPSVLWTSSAIRHTSTTQPATAPRMLNLLCPLETYTLVHTEQKVHTQYSLKVGQGTLFCCGRQLTWHAACNQEGTKKHKESHAYVIESLGNTLEIGREKTGGVWGRTTNSSRCKIDKRLESYLQPARQVCAQMWVDENRTSKRKTNEKDLEAERDRSTRSHELLTCCVSVG